MSDMDAESPPDQPKRPRRRVSRHAVKRARSALAFLDEHQRINGRSLAGRFIRRETLALTADLGGDLSHQQSVMVRLAARQALLVELIDGWLFTVHPVNRGRRTLLPVVRERQAIVDGLTRMLTTLGLDRRAKPVQTLADLLRERERADLSAESQAAFAPSGNGAAAPADAAPVDAAADQDGPP